MGLQRVHLVGAVVVVPDAGFGRQQQLDIKFQSVVERLEHLLGILVLCQEFEPLLEAHLFGCPVGKTEYTELGICVQHCPGVYTVLVVEPQTGEVLEFQLERKTELAERLGADGSIGGVGAIFLVAEFLRNIFPLALDVDTVIVGGTNIDVFCVEFAQLAPIIKPLIAFLPLVRNAVLVEEIVVDANTKGKENAGLLGARQVAARADTNVEGRRSHREFERDVEFLGAVHKTFGIRAAFFVRIQVILAFVLGTLLPFVDVDIAVVQDGQFPCLFVVHSQIGSPAAASVEIAFQRELSIPIGVVEVRIVHAAGFALQAFYLDVVLLGAFVFLQVNAVAGHRRLAGREGDVQLGQPLDELSVDIFLLALSRGKLIVRHSGREGLVQYVDR